MTDNALSTIGGSPPAPVQPSQESQGSALSMGMGAPAPQQQQPQQQQIPPPLSHQQMVATLRHFDMIKAELMGLLADPDLGKSDLKSKFIDGATKLVASGTLKPTDAVVQLGTVPERPFEQKQWVLKHLATTMQSADAVLAHHGAAFAGQDAQAGTPYNSDDHQSIMSGVLSHFQGMKPNA